MVLVPDWTRLARLRVNRLPPPQQDVVIAVAFFVVGGLLYTTRYYVLFRPDDTAPLWARFAVLAAICAAQLLRRGAPAMALGLGALGVGVDAVLGLSVPPLIVLSDLIYAATLYGSRRLSRAMIPMAAVLTVGAMVVALVLVPEWRLAVLAAVVTVPFVATPVWWAINVREQRDIAAAERANADQLARIAELDRTAALAAERARMARDLHDVISGHLSAIAIQSSAALSRGDPATAGVVLRSVRENSVHALEEMRAMIDLLRANGAEDDLAAPARLRELSRLVGSARAAGITVDLHSEVGDGDALPAAVDLTAYRIAQEALTNAMKHAPGTRVRLLVLRRGAELSVEVSNELTGGGVATADTGTGLLNMRERATAIGGSLSAGPAGTGWHVRAVLPIPEPGG
ncbi:Signal transduction histidine kinase [Amycolatopsis arida]|uniref:histidine kinase n=1 Tax=Amycolatopsis arida TaxID=587909 RepID=A0A1I5ZWZ2_9PSEU|nr:histidine kinase [Amycolatopsis arida]TDX89432.1 signal transduction histidine kinase [Amycolatopsis arida]SFQ60999.1 Signal transduction histidine kinase [Amycolatopsis arida]